MAQNLKGGHRGALEHPLIFLVFILVQLLVLNIIIFMLGHNIGSSRFVKMYIPARI